jgi:hypothetical protein
MEAAPLLTIHLREQIGSAIGKLACANLMEE